MAIVAVSPHLDDAALSASVRLYGVGATVLTVFTAPPGPDISVTSWDRLTGARSSAERQAERLAEDAEAMGILSAYPGYLGEQEALYRTADPDPDLLAKRIAAHFADGDEIWLPSAIGGHRDHRVARDAGLRAAAAVGRSQVVCYADFPYVIAYGWPAWVTGQSADPYLDAGFWLAEELSMVGLESAAMVPEVVQLSADQRARKARIAAAYRSQAPALGLTADDLARNPAKLDYELCWRTDLSEALSVGIAG